MVVEQPTPAAGSTVTILVDGLVAKYWQLLMPPTAIHAAAAHPAHWSGSGATHLRAWMYMIGTPGIFLNRFFRSLSHVATMKHRCTRQCSTMSSSA